MFAEQALQQAPPSLGNSRVVLVKSWRNPKETCYTIGMGVLTKEDKDAIKAMMDEIADQLGESENNMAKAAIWRAINRLGPDRVRELVTQAIARESEGGMWTREHERRRTLGGVFFALLKEGLEKRERGYILGSSRGAPTTGEGQPQSPKSKKPYHWQVRMEILREIGIEIGRANSVKITLTGRPGKVVERNMCVMTVMAAMKRPDLPKGLPTPPEKATFYTVYIATKQWRKVAPSIASDPEDVLIIEGFAAFDEQIKGIAVFAINTTTRKLVAQQREAMRAKIEADQSSEA